MCGCNKAKPAEATWQVDYPDQPSKEFTSSVQARVAAARVPGAVAKPKAT